MTQEPQEEQLTAQENAEESQPNTAQENKSITPEQAKKLEQEIRKQQLLAQLEEESAESVLGHLCRSKNFWYTVFGSIFVIIMGALILWAAHDLGYWGK